MSNTGRVSQASRRETSRSSEYDAGEQTFADMNAINRKQLFPQVNKWTLPYRRQQLFRGDGVRSSG
ncbi:hypothetical protein ACLK1T_05955 [Escherichia coli]